MYSSLFQIPIRPPAQIFVCFLRLDKILNIATLKIEFPLTNKKGGTLITFHGVRRDRSVFIRPAFEIMEASLKKMMLKTTISPVIVTIEASEFWKIGSKKVGKSLEDAKTSFVPVLINDNNVMIKPERALFYKVSNEIFMVIFIPLMQF